MSTHGNSASASEFLQAAVREAMQDAWNTICSDTGCHPTDINRQGRNLFFQPAHWANLTALLLAARLSSDDRYKRCTITGFVIDTAFAAEKPTAEFTTRGRR